MPLPFLIGAAAVAGATGIYKGIKAKEIFEKAGRRGRRAERALNEAQLALDQARKETNTALESLGRTKVAVLSNQIQHLVDVIKKGRSNLKDFAVDISADELKECEVLTRVALDLDKGIGKGAVAGAFAAMGAYGVVGSFATASTGAAISGLSGAAATNATLAWLGGGSLAAGGMGMAGGMVALGGIVLGPALAVGGFMLASKAEEALTQANLYEANVHQAIAKIEIGKTGLKAIRTNAAESSEILLALAKRYDKLKVNDTGNKAAFGKMLQVGRAIKAVLDTPLMDKEGAAIIGLTAQLSGFREVAGAEVN